MTIAIPKKDIDFAKDNLARIAVVENDAENGNEVEDEGGVCYYRKLEPMLFKICIYFLMKYMTLGSNPIFKYTL